MSTADWRPTAARDTLARRAELLERVRGFFKARQVLEVDTPLLVNAPVTDVHIHSAEVRLRESAHPFFLHTSPEYAMKRLLAAGSGDIFQICHVVRGFERGKLHNAEFTLIEWYRLGFGLERLMDEVAALACELLGARAVERLTYREAFLAALRLDPLAASTAELRAVAQREGIDLPLERDPLLDALMALVIGPRLGIGKLTFIHRYPASQAALARLDPNDARTALRFELYAEGVELANGFHELASAAEQRARFESDNALRREQGLPVYPLDERFLAALAAGLPDCSGVALGFDRLAMLALGARRIDDVLSFPIERA